MKNVGTYKITRQGQITVPAEVRKELDLEEGDMLDFFYADDVIVLKKKREPAEVFKELAEKATKRFKERGITRKEVGEEIKKYRAA